MIKVNENNMVNARDIYSFVEVKTRFNDWIRNCINHADLKEDIDFYLNLSKINIVGRPQRDYLFTLQAAKEVCIVSATSKAKELRRWLIELSNQKENLDLLTHDQVVMLSVLKSFFRYVDNQKEYLEKHKKSYVENNHSRNPYAEFNIWRNKILGIEKDVLDAKIKQYCIENSKRLPKLSTSHDKIRFLNEYDSLKNAVWDFLSIKGEVNAMKLAELVKRMAQAENLVVFQRNEENLFQSKENINLKQLK